jgi:hypothetical protein
MQSEVDSAGVLTPKQEMVVLNEGSSTVQQQVSDISTEKKKRGRKPK